MTGPKRPGRVQPSKLGSPFTSVAAFSGGQRSLEAFNQMGTICGYCADRKWVPCPDCGGFAGCHTCHKRTEVACPDCSGGDLPKFQP